MQKYILNLTQTADQYELSPLKLFLLNFKT